MKNQPITNEPVHIIYRLHGSIPGEQLIRIRKEYDDSKYKIIMDFESDHKISTSKLERFQVQLVELQANFQLKYDQLLNDQKLGPFWLTDEFAKETVIKSWLHLEGLMKIEIDAILVMSNHVHVILAARDDVQIDLTELLERHKRFTGRIICNHLNLNLDRFWAKGAFDRLVRRAHYGTVLWYVLNSPVKAGLTNDPLNWTGNYLSPRLRNDIF